MLLYSHGNVREMHQHQFKLGASSGRCSGQQTHKHPAGVPGFSLTLHTGCRFRGSPAYPTPYGGIRLSSWQLLMEERRRPFASPFSCYAREETVS